MSIFEILILVIFLVGVVFIATWITRKDFFAGPGALRDLIYERGNGIEKHSPGSASDAERKHRIHIACLQLSKSKILEALALEDHRWFRNDNYIGGFRHMKIELAIQRMAGISGLRFEEEVSEKDKQLLQSTYEAHKELLRINKVPRLFSL